MELFERLNKLTYKQYLEIFPFHIDLELDLTHYKVNLKSLGGFEDKIKKDLWSSVDKHNQIAFPAEMDDLIRLHYLVVSRKVTTILELGVGKSTSVFDHALSYNKKTYFDYVKNNLRRSDIFQCYSVDSSKKWIKSCKKSFKTQNVNYYFSKCRTGTFNDRICTFYDSLPNICPDFIYIDAPDQHSVLGNVAGLSTRHDDRLPMSGDVLRLEPFLLPGTLIVIDGRTSNARFLLNNLQRKWEYYYESNYDQHFFELIEEPLGRYNKKQLDFTKSQHAEFNL